MHVKNGPVRTITAMTAAALLTATTAYGATGTEAFDKGIQPILGHYLAIHDKLANDSTEGIDTEADALAAATAHIGALRVAGEHEQHYASIPNDIEKAARAVAAAKSLDAAREAFKDLSRPLAMWATMSHPADMDVVYCEMAKASWLQHKGEVRNPYYGKEMLSCGEVVGAAAPGKHPMKHGGDHAMDGKKMSGHDMDGKKMGGRGHEMHE